MSGRGQYVRAHLVDTFVCSPALRRHLLLERVRAVVDSKVSSNVALYTGATTNVTNRALNKRCAILYWPWCVLLNRGVC